MLALQSTSSPRPRPADFPCDAGFSPDVSFGTKRRDGSDTNVGLSFRDRGVSLGAQANTFVTLQQLCHGTDSAAELVRVLNCAPAVGIVQLCPDLYRCDVPLSVNGTGAGSARVGTTRVHLTVQNGDQGEAAVRCYADNLQVALERAVRNFPQQTRPPLRTPGLARRMPTTYGAKDAAAGMLLFAVAFGLSLIFHARRTKV